jgi:hypothetical protein
MNDKRAPGQDALMFVPLASKQRNISVSRRMIPELHLLALYLFLFPLTYGPVFAEGKRERKSSFLRQLSIRTLAGPEASFDMPRDAAIRLYQQFCPSFSLNPGGTKLCGKPLVTSKIVRRCGYGHNLTRLKAAAVTAKSIFFYYVGQRLDSNYSIPYGVTMECPAGSSNAMYVHRALI